LAKAVKDVNKNILVLTAEGICRKDGTISAKNTTACKSFSRIWAFIKKH
jgi:hypothetical protein